MSEITPVQMEALRRQVAAQPHPLAFVTVSGAHLYGFASPDSDFDLRGIHILPIRDVVRLDPPVETLDTSVIDEGLEIDTVTHDVKKFFNLMLKRNGYVLEQVTSPLIVHTTPWHEELRTIAPKCVTRHHVHHYRGFSKNEWESLQKQPRLKGLLYTYRVLLTGIHLMRTGEVEANLPWLAEAYGHPYLLPLVEQKRTGEEKGAVGESLDVHAPRIERLMRELDEAGEATTLPWESSAREDLDDLLVRIRLHLS
jgi:hypothetical protein